jgi:threonine synthase
MKFVSNRDRSHGLSFSEGVLASLSSDGGLYVPESFPTFRIEDFDPSNSWTEVAQKVLAPFLQASALESKVDSLCKKAFNFEIPLKYLTTDTAVLELFHGPTAAFKDVGARFLSECISEIITQTPSAKTTILVATSGDTGGAVAAAFFNKPGITVKVLFPKGKISARQEKQLTAWGGNIQAYSVRGDFDACQRIVKEAFADKELKKKEGLLSANSINLGRILPQTVYYADASMRYLRKKKRIPGFVIPSGNLGNAVAAFWAKKMGFPIRKIILATNANHAIPDYFKSGRWAGQPTQATLANAMDVGHPSNMERLLALYPDLEDLKQDASSLSVSDQLIAETIAAGPENWGETWCPHTATAVYAREQERTKDWIIVSTAHPAKFESIVEPLVKKTITLPPELETLLSRPQLFTEIEASLAQLKANWSPQ